MAKKSLALFMTRNISLKDWHELGIIKRELASYNMLSKYFKAIYIFSYGKKEDLNFRHYLKGNIKIIYKKSNLNSTLYSFLMPLINYKTIKKCHFFKTNQIDGSWPALAAKFLNPKAKLIVRTGYVLSSLLANKKKRFKYLIFSIVELIMYKLADLVMITSDRNKDYIQKRYNVKKIAVMPNFIDTNIFKPLNCKKERKLVFVGRLNNEKNLINLLKALEGTDIAIDIIGKGELESSLKALAKKLKLKANFLGTIDNYELPEYLCKASAFVLPSFHEGMPKALLEAMSCGVACIGTDVPGIKDFIQHNKTGVLTKTDSRSLRKAIIGLISDKKLQQRLGKNARKYIVDNFSLKKLIKKEIGCYESLTK